MKQTVLLGTRPLGSGGDTNYIAFTKVNENFTELYDAIGASALAGQAVLTQEHMSDSVSTTSSTTVASATAVKTAYDLAVSKLDPAGNAGSATKLATARSITITGDADFTTSFDGTADVSATLTLKPSGVIAGAYGSSYTIPGFTVNAKGLVTETNEVSIPEASTLQKGLTQLSDSVSSTATDQAATANAVRQAYDLANAAIPANKLGVPNGVPTTDENGLIPSNFLPSYVDDVLEFANLAAMPNPGERAKIYVALDTGKTYRWADTTYVNVGGAEIADAAYKLNSARSISATGDATWSASFDGTTDTTGILTLTATGVTEGNYGTDINVPSLTLDAKGRVVTAVNTAIRESSTAQTGVVQLNDTTNSTSITQAATANAVKTVNDLATTANQTANAAIPSSQKGVANGVPTLGANGYIPDSQIRVPAQFLGNQAVMPIVYNAKEITADVTIPGNTNAMSAGPLSVADGVTVTIETDATWTIV